jgi:hypothetical protein
MSVWCLPGLRKCLQNSMLAFGRRRLVVAHSFAEARAESMHNGYLGRAEVGSEGYVAVVILGRDERKAFRCRLMSHPLISSGMLALQVRGVVCILHKQHKVR